MGCAVWKAPSFVLVCIRYVATWNVNVRPRAPRDSPRSRRQSPVRRRARGRRDLSCSWAPDPRHVTAPRPYPAAWLRVRPGGWRPWPRPRVSRFRRVGRFQCFDLPGRASVRVTVPRLFQHLLLPHPLARPASALRRADPDPSSRDTDARDSRDLLAFDTRPPARGPIVAA